MRVGIIAEGPADLAVIVNILRGRLDLDFENVQFLRPEYALDETDLHEMKERRFSNWELVKEECVSGALITEFLDNQLDEERLVVVHIDTAEAERAGFEVNRPDRNSEDYAEELRRRVVARVDDWIAGRAKDRVRHAVAVEEMDAWILTLDTDEDTTRYPDPKRRLQKFIERRYKDKERKRLFQRSSYERYHELTRELRRRKTLETCASRNRSLRAFLDSFSSDQ